MANFIDALKEEYSFYEGIQASQAELYQMQKELLEKVQRSTRALTSQEKASLSVALSAMGILEKVSHEVQKKLVMRIGVIALSILGIYSLGLFSLSLFTGGTSLCKLLAISGLSVTAAAALYKQVERLEQKDEELQSLFADNASAGFFNLDDLLDSI